MKLIFFIFFLSLQISLSVYDLTPKIPEEYEIAPWYGFKPSAITYSFDDGSPNHLGKVVPLFDKYNLKASFNLITNVRNDWDGYKAAAENGHEIASHTVTHSHPKEQDDETQNQEYKESKKLIEKMIGQECITLVYPYCEAGNYNIIKNYYISARSCSNKFISSNPDDILNLSSIGIGSNTNYKTAEDINGLVDKALEQKEWIVFLIHGIDNQAYSPFDSFELETHLKYVIKKDSFWVATFKDISKYILEANSLIILENKNEDGDIVIEVSTEYKTELTVLDVPVTVSRKMDEKCKKVIIINENDSSKIDVEIKDGKAIFDVIPDEKYILKCQ